MKNLYQQKFRHFVLTPMAGTILAAFAINATAQQTADAPSGEVSMPLVTVVGAPDKLPKLAGAGEVLDKKTLESSRVFNVNEALRKIPGIHAREEEGFGLRPNIGMRGLNPTRSTKISLLEDGIPLAYAPYGDNASYYHPSVDRFDRIEVLKGAGSLLYGPQTLAGVINYITPAPPRQSGGYFQGVVGNRDYVNAKVNAGGQGMLLDYSHKQGEGARDNSRHKIDDLNLKYVFGISANQGLTLRANYQREDSQVTYSGLTQGEFDRLGARYNPFKNDNFRTDRIGVSATHDYQFSNGANVLTNFYFSRFDRDWWRQASNSQDAQCGATFNAARLAGTGVNPDACNSVQGRLRSYKTWGVEPRLTVKHGMGELQAGVRAHFEEQDRLQVNGTSPTARTGTLAESNLRKTDAHSFFVSNRFDLGNFSVTPVIRHERIEAERVNRLTAERGNTTVSATLPGIGAMWNPTNDLTLFTSLHKGFAPPRVEDLIGGSGTVAEVPEERSANFEFGVRTKPAANTSFQAAAFRNRYQNLVAAGSIAGGSTPLSQGKALFSGLELSGQTTLNSGIFGRAAYTWLPIAEQQTPFRNVASNAVVGGSAAGLRQPYAPKHTLTLAAGYENAAFRGEIETQTVGEQFSDFANSLAPTADGQRGRISGYTVVNSTANYRFDKALTAFLTVKNLTDKTYIVDRTRGILVGMPRQVQVGLRYAF